MKTSQTPSLQRLLPPNAPVSERERMRASVGALPGIPPTGLANGLLVDARVTTLRLTAPLGASAVLLTGAPASPLAPPWSIVGGCVSAAPVGVGWARLIRTPVVAAAAAIFVSIGTLFALRCLHPPNGAVARAAAHGEAQVHEVVGPIMGTRVETVLQSTPVVELVASMADVGHHAVPIASSSAW